MDIIYYWSTSRRAGNIDPHLKKKEGLHGEFRLVVCVNAPTPHPDSLSCVTSLKSALNSLPLLVNWPYWCVRGHATRDGEKGGDVAVWPLFR